MRKFDPEVLLEEVSELTELLRCDPGFANIREALRKMGLDPHQCILGGFMESEDCEEWGLIVTPDEKQFEYYLVNEPQQDPTEFNKVKYFESLESAADIYAAATVARNYVQISAGRN